jgi:hypothetical protein
MSKNYKYSSNTQYGGNTFPTMSELLGSAYYAGEGNEVNEVKTASLPSRGFPVSLPAKTPDVKTAPLSSRGFDNSAPLPSRGFPVSLPAKTPDIKTAPSTLGVFLERPEIINKEVFPPTDLSATSLNVDNATSPMSNNVPNILSATSSMSNNVSNILSATSSAVGTGVYSATSSAVGTGVYSATSSAVNTIGTGVYSATSKIMDALNDTLPELPVLSDKTDTNNNSINPNTKFYYIVIDTNLSYLKNLEGNNGIYGAVRQMISSEQIPMLLSLEKAEEVAHKITKCAEINGCLFINGIKVRPVIGCVIVTYVLNDNSLSISKLGNIDNYDNLKSSGTDVTLYIKDNVERAVINSNALGSFKIESLSLVKTCGFELSNDVVMQLYTLNNNLSVENVRLLNQLLKNNYVTNKQIDEIDCKTSLQNGGDPYKLKYKKYKALANRLEKEALSRGIKL